MMVSAPVLLINFSYEPLRIIRGRDAIRLMVKGKADVVLGRKVDVTPGMEMPSVIRLREYRRVPHTQKVMSRRNILQRDAYLCMYCNRLCNFGEASLDHVIPRSKGGKSDWDNLVTACKKCNHRKADRTPEEAGMPLLRRPLPRTVHTGRYVLRAMGTGIPEWNRYMFGDSEGEKGLVQRG